MAGRPVIAPPHDRPLKLVLAPRSVDPFSKKDWYDIKAPTMFSVRNIGKTLVTRTQGTKVSQAAGALAWAHGDVQLMPSCLPSRRSPPTP